jgi:hypothetical protein
MMIMKSLFKNVIIYAACVNMAAIIIVLSTSPAAFCRDPGPRPELYLGFSELLGHFRDAGRSAALLVTDKDAAKIHHLTGPASPVSRLSYDIADIIVSGLAEDDFDTAEEFLKLYGDTHVLEKPAFKKVIRSVRDYMRTLRAAYGADAPEDLEKLRLCIDSRADIEDNGLYYFRKGRELSSEIISKYWKEISQTFQKKTTAELEIDLELFKTLMTAGKINVISQSEPYQKVIGGQARVLIRCRICVTETLTIKAVKKFALTRITFELFRARTTFFNNKWELCGQTFEMRELYTD